MGMTKIAINGFGRIGRCIARAVIEEGHDDIEIVAINDLTDPDNLAYLLRFDSVHGRFPGKVTSDGDWIDIGRGKVRVTNERDIAELDWSGVDIVMECTGVFTAREDAAKHLKQGAKRVLISAPGKNADKTVAYGVNHDVLSAEDVVVSNASCTTNALAPLAKVLDEAFGIESGFMTTVHSYTGDQPTLDRPHRKDWRRGRAAAMSMVPTSTGAAKAISLVLPRLDGKLDGAAIRVPTPNVSVVDLSVVTAKATTVEEVNTAFKTAAMQGVLQYLTEKSVSIDLNHDSHSSSLVSHETKVTGGNLVRVLSWYDNEWGFSNRMLDTASVMGRFL